MVADNLQICNVTLRYEIKFIGKDVVRGWEALTMIGSKFVSCILTAHLTAVQTLFCEQLSLSILFLKNESMNVTYGTFIGAD